MSEWTRLKPAIPKSFVDILKRDDRNLNIENKPAPYTLKNILEFYDKKFKMVENKNIKLKLLQICLLPKIKPTCEDKWDTYFNKDFPWKIIWANLDKNLAKGKLSNSVEKFSIT